MKKGIERQFKADAFILDKIDGSAKNIEIFCCDELFVNSDGFMKVKSKTKKMPRDATDEPNQRPRRS